MMSEQWPVKTLGEVISLEYGKPLSKEDRDPDGQFPVYGANGEKARSNKFYHSKPTIIVGRKGSAGELNLSKEKFWPLDVTYFVTFDEGKYEMKFLYYLLQSLNLPSMARGVKPGINRNDVYAIEVRIPSLEEQQRIVKILDEALDNIDNAKLQAQMNLQGAYGIFTSFLDTIINDTNNDWKDTVLGDEYDVRDGTHDSPKYHEEGHYLMTSKNLKREGLTYAKAKFISPTDYQQINKRSKVDKGDVLLAMIGTIGNPVLIEEEPDFAIKNVALFKVGKKNGKFLKYLLQSKSNMEKMLRDASGTTQRFVSLRYLRGFPIKLPSDEDQHLIVKKLDKLFDNTEQLAKKYTAESENLEELKQSILQEAFNGNLTKEITA
jgi:type I restriction enzyme, S subunit